MHPKSRLVNHLLCMNMTCIQSHALLTCYAEHDAKAILHNRKLLSNMHKMMYLDVNATLSKFVSVSEYALHPNGYFLP